MTELVEFKREMKAGQARDRVHVKEIEEEIKKLDGSSLLLLKNLYNETGKFGYNLEKVTTITSDQLRSLSPKLYTEMLLNSEYRKRLGESQSGNIEIVLNDFLEETKNRCRGLYNANQVIINAIENDRINNYIDLERLMVHMVYSELPFESTLKVFGLIVGFNIGYIQKHGISSKKNGWIIDLFREFFDINGELLLVDDIYHFKSMVSLLLNEYRISYKLLEGESLIKNGLYEKLLRNSNAIVDAWAHLVMINNAKLEMEAMHQDDEEDVEVLETFKEDVPRDYLDELKRYYKSGELIEIPEDSLAFNELLDKCEIDEKEKRYVLGLVNEELENRNNAKILKHLNTSDQKTYQKAEELLKGMHHTNGDYYTLIQLLDDLKAAGEMLEEVNNEGKIRRLETLVKDENSRNSVLVSHEAYLSLFNPDAPNTSRKRATE